MRSAAIGLLTWTLVEYLLHRFAFHRFAKLTRSFHPQHHATPRDLRYLFARPAMVAGLSAIALTGLSLGMGGAIEALKLMAGFWMGYAYYELVHYRIHFQNGEGWLLRKQRSAHFRHHFSDPRRNFGVTTPFWDWVFRTSYRLSPVIVVGLGLLLWTTPGHSQDLGHKLPGTIGLDAARIPEPGLYLVDRVVFYEADQLRDREGNVIPTGDLRFSGLSNAAGISYTSRIHQRPLFFTASAAAPVARLRLNIQDRPEASFDRFGLTDIYLQPARLGWRQERADLVAAYSLYLPTGRFPLAGSPGLSTGHITHEFSLGGTLYGSRERNAFVTALGSYNLNLRKRGIDIKRGDTFQIQGGVGVRRFNRRVEAGVAAYALWQVQDDRGADIPPILRGARDRVYGLGPEAAVFVQALRSEIRARYVWDLGVRSRPQGALLVVGLNFVARRPTPPVVRRSML